MKIKRVVAIIVAVVFLFSFAGSTEGCTEADRVNHNLNIQADNFNITREITVFNTRTDTVLFQMIGVMSLSNNMSHELVVTVQTGENEFKKHYIYLSDDVTYVMEDVSGSYTSKYFYQLNVNPMLMLPFVQPVYVD